jgi:signal transduction histidine kinase
VADRPAGDRVARELFLVALLGALAAALFEIVNAGSVVDTVEIAAIVLAVASIVALRRRLLLTGKLPSVLVQQHDRVIVRETSHQLRTPITIARGHAELLRAAVKGVGESDLHLEIILDELDRMARLTERMLILASAGDPGFLVSAPVTIDALAVDIARRWKPTAKRRWTVDCLDDTTILADASRLTVAIDAFVENAIQHTCDGDLILISSRCDDDEVIFSVRDTGRGMTEHEQNALRTALDNDTGGGPRRSGGTGLGLRIARAIAEAHYGHLTIEGKRGFGCEFALHVPLIRTPARPHNVAGLAWGGV